VCYLDNILIYSTDEKEYEEQVRKVLEPLREFGLYCKARKWQFGVLEVAFLGVILNSEGIGIESDRIATLEDWLVPKSIRDVHELLGFANFYRRFIRKYEKVTLPLTELLNTTTETARTPNASAKALEKLNKP
jgi:hypothetical protein